MSYDPAVGRWLQQDPDEFDAGDPNLSRYVGNDPVNATDPSGLFDEPDDGSRQYSAKKMLSPYLGPVGPLGLQIPIAGSPPAPKMGSESHFTDRNWAIPTQGWQSIGITSPDQQTAAAFNGVAITAFKAPASAARILPGLKKADPVYYANVTEKDLANVIQHVLWLSFMSLSMGEQKARDIAWIHEQYGSDGWSDTLKDFHNNNIGLKIAEEIKQEIGPDGMRLFVSQGVSDNGKWSPNIVNPTIGPNLRYQAVELQIYTKLRDKMRSAISNKEVAIFDASVSTAKYPDITEDARKFWDADVTYSMPSKNPVLDRKPATRP